MSQNGMKKYAWLVLTATVFLFAGGCGKVEESELETEEVTEQLLEEAETEMDTAQSEAAEEESQIVDDPAEIDLKYISEMEYDDNIQLGGPYKMEDNLYDVDFIEKRNYACWKDWLVIGPEVYQKQEDGRYKRLGEYYLEEIFKKSDFSGDSWDRIRQYKNFLIYFQKSGEFEGYFCLYDMDTEKMVEIDVSEEGGIFGRDYYIFEGKIYYQSTDCKSIRTIDLSNGKNEEFYRLTDTAYHRIQNFAIREDGAVMAVFLGEEANPDDLPEEKRNAHLPCHIEYWCIEPSENGMKETKIGETDDFSSSDIQVVGEGLVLDCDVPERDNWVSISNYYLKENGEMTSIALFGGHGFNRVRCVEDGFYYFEESLFNAISKYDFDGNKIDTYCLADPAKLEEGYQIIEVIIYDGKATAFFVDENEEYLYISQVPVE